MNTFWREPSPVMRDHCWRRSKCANWYFLPDFVTGLRVTGSCVSANVQHWCKLILECWRPLHEQFKIPRPPHGPISLLLQLQRSNSLSSSSFDDLTEAAEESSASDPELSESSQLQRRMLEYNSVYFPGSDFLARASQPASSPRGSATLRGSHIDTDEIDDDPLLRRFSRAADAATVMQNAFEDLEYLLQEFVAAECIGWTLLVATLLFRVRLLQSTLKRYPPFWKLYRPMLVRLAETSKGYRDLLGHLDSFMSGNVVALV